MNRVFSRILNRLAAQSSSTCTRVERACSRSAMPGSISSSRTVAAMGADLSDPLITPSRDTTACGEMAMMSAARTEVWLASQGMTSRVAALAG